MRSPEPSAYKFALTRTLQLRGNRDTSSRFSYSGLIVGEVRMKRATVLVVVLLSLSTPPAFGRMPELSVKAVCKARSDDARKVKAPPDQSMTDCVRDERSKFAHRLGSVAPPSIILGWSS